MDSNAEVPESKGLTRYDVVRRLYVTRRLAGHHDMADDLLLREPCLAWRAWAGEGISLFCVPIPLETHH